MKALLLNPHSECSPVACSGVKLLQKPATTQQPAASIQQTGQLGRGKQFSPDLIGEKMLVETKS